MNSTSRLHLYIASRSRRSTRDGQRVSARRRHTLPATIDVIATASSARNSRRERADRSARARRDSSSHGDDVREQPEVSSIFGARRIFSVPDPSSSRTALFGSKATPNPASTSRFCAERLSTSMISASARPAPASWTRRSHPKSSRLVRSGNPIRRSPVRGSAAPDARRRWGAVEESEGPTTTISSSPICRHWRSGFPSDR